jgi:hypothetical protein
MDGVAELADLADVASTAPSDGQVLTYDTVNGWQPETPSGGGTIDGSGTANYIAKWSDSDTLTDSVIYESSGNIGIGTTSPNEKLVIQNGTSFSSVQLTDGTNNTFFAHAAADTNYANPALAGDAVVRGSNGVTISGNSGAFGMRLNSSGNLTFPNGQGIDFSASEGGGATSSLLDDYEEGTFTATLRGSVSDPTTPVNSTGKYTKIGNQVTVWVLFSSDDTDGASGEVTVSGLPFTSASTFGGVGAALTFDLNFNLAEYLIAFLFASSTTVELIGSRSSDTWRTATHTGSSTVTIRTTITYFI